LESVDFDTTVEEMILYDMFGEDYDEVRGIFIRN
jgi:hypothetical protein